MITRVNGLSNFSFKNQPEQKKDVSDSLYNLKTQPDEVILSGENAKSSKKSKMGIVLGFTTISAIIIGLVLRGRLTQAKDITFKFAENIDYKKAETIEEAREFSKTKLGIKTVDDAMPLDILNWVNEGLVNINNVRKGKAKLPDSLGYQAMDSDILACVIQKQDGGKFGSILNINKNALDSLDEYFNINIKSFIEDGLGVFKEGSDGKLSVSNFYSNSVATPSLIEKVNKWREDSSSFSIIDKIQFYEDFSKLNHAVNSFYNAPLSKLEQLLKNPGIEETLLMHFNLPDINQIKKLTTEQQRNVLVNVVNTCLSSGDRINLGYSKGDKFETIYHEIGHLEHCTNIGYENYMKLGKPEECISYLGKVSDETSEFLQNQEKQQTAYRVTPYATESPAEFVAEVYRRIIQKRVAGDTKPLNEDIMRLYSEYKGVAV